VKINLGFPLLLRLKSFHEQKQTARSWHGSGWCVALASFPAAICGCVNLPGPICLSPQAPTALSWHSRTGATLWSHHKIKERKTYKSSDHQERQLSYSSWALGSHQRRLKRSHIGHTSTAQNIQKKKKNHTSDEHMWLFPKQYSKNNYLHSMHTNLGIVASLQYTRGGAFCIRDLRVWGFGCSEAPRISPLTQRDKWCFDLPPLTHCT
jgi:uncharacterized protein YegJ (DUF2314 family)